jgi:Uncharacterized protein conserved in bacteria
MKLCLSLLALGAAAAAVPSSAPAQNAELDAARRTGQVGERYDGYLGYASTPSASVQRQVQAINIRRRTLYVDLGRRRNVTPEVAGIATGCELLKRVAVGESYMLSDRTWRRRSADEAVPHPSYCS